MTNLYARNEVPVYRAPLIIVLGFAILAVGALIGTIYLEATQSNPPSWRDLLPKVTLPAIHSKRIQHAVDASLQGVR